MGIQRFGAHMRGHAVRCTLGSSEAPVKNSIGIIDGPGLAHYIYYRLCAKHTVSVGTITYEDCASAVIAWLDDLRTIGFTVEAILFDAVLPRAKKDVRISRLQSYVTRLHTYKEHIGSGVPILSGQARQNLPPPPFMVFSIVEELLKHDTYGDVTFAVPGEADPYCVVVANAAALGDSKPNAVIFSDDADLLVYRLNDRTSVAPFRDLTDNIADRAVLWTCEQYWPRQIVGKASNSLESLIKPAYYMAKDPHCTLDSAFRKVEAADPAAESDFDKFSKMFDTATESESWSAVAASSTRNASSATRDSRVSELIYEVQLLGTGDGEGGLRMYLPFQIEDPVRKSAWSVGGELRALAYSALTLSVGSDAGVQEYRRSGVRIAGTVIEPLSEKDSEARLQELSIHLQKTLAWLTDHTELQKPDRWRYLILQHTLSDLVADGYALPTIADSLHIVNNQQDQKWDLIHLSAQYQAAYYSFRMLKQIMSFVTAQEACKVSDNSMAAVELVGSLEGLPRIAEFFRPTQSECKAKEERVWHDILSSLLVTLRGDDLDDREPRKRRKKSKKSKSIGQTRTDLARNPFAVLADE